MITVLFLSNHSFMHSFSKYFCISGSLWVMDIHQRRRPSWSLSSRQDIQRGEENNTSVTSVIKGAAGCQGRDSSVVRGQGDLKEKKELSRGVMGESVTNKRISDTSFIFK